MRGQMTHPDTDLLAEFGAWLIAGRRGRRIGAHVAGCDRCAALGDRLAGVSALLAGVPPPVLPPEQRAALVVADMLGFPSPMRPSSSIPRPAR